MADNSKIYIGEPIPGFNDRRKSQAITVTPVTGPNNFSAYIYQCWLNVDWDGAHNAYGLKRPPEGTQKFPQQQNVTPLESGSGGTLLHARAGGKGRWVGLVAMTREEALKILRANYPKWDFLGDPKKPGSRAEAQEDVLNQFLDTRTNTEFGTLEDKPGNKKFPIVQLKELNQPYPGYYVSQSPAFNRSGHPQMWDQNIYLDAAKVAYSVVPKLVNVRAGDYGLVIRNKTGKNTPFFFGDTASTEGSTQLGESSGYIYNKIAEGKYNDELFTFIVFDGSGTGVADQKAVDYMKKAVWIQVSKLADADNAIPQHFAQEPADVMNLRNALREHGGPGLWVPKSCAAPEFQ